MGVLAAAVDSSSSLPPELIQYFNFTGLQVQSVNELNRDFAEKVQKEYMRRWWQIIRELNHSQDQPFKELLATKPDSADAANMEAWVERFKTLQEDGERSAAEMRVRHEALERDYYARVVQLQNSIAALFTQEQMMIINRLLEVVPLQSLIPDAKSVYMLPASSSPINFRWSGEMSRMPGMTSASSMSYSGVFISGQRPEVPQVLVEYLHLSEEQLSAIGDLGPEFDAAKSAEFGAKFSFRLQV